MATSALSGEDPIARYCCCWYWFVLCPQNIEMNTQVSQLRLMEVDEMSGEMLYSYYEGVVAKPDQQPSQRSMGQQMMKGNNNMTSNGLPRRRSMAFRYRNMQKTRDPRFNQALLERGAVLFLCLVMRLLIA